MKTGLFWEVNERVIAFDWVEEPLRTQIPRLRGALRRAKGGTPEVQEAPAPQKLVQPTQISLPVIPVLPDHQGNGSGAAATPSQETASASSAS